MGEPQDEWGEEGRGGLPRLHTYGETRPLTHAQWSAGRQRLSASGPPGNSMRQQETSLDTSGGGTSEAVHLLFEITSGVCPPETRRANCGCYCLR